MSERIPDDVIVVDGPLDMARLAGGSLHASRGVPYILEVCDGAIRVKGADRPSGDPGLVFALADETTKKRG